MERKKTLIPGILKQKNSQLAKLQCCSLQITQKLYKEQGTVVYINRPKNFLDLKCALIKA
jgi:hypothetical protein